MDWFHKTQGCGADVNLVDLEDAVPPRQKDQARASFLQLRREHIKGPFGLRINSVRTTAGIRDLHAVLDAEVEPDIIVLPKVVSPHDVELVDDLLSSAGKSSSLWALIESADGVLNARPVASSSGRLTALTFGSADFCADIGVPLDWDALSHARSQLVLAAKAQGLEAVDAPTFDLGRLDVVAEEARKSAALGFTGKIAIHPRQLAAINAAYSPTDRDIEWATRVATGYRDDDAAIVNIDGQMIGPPFVKSADSILTRAKVNP
jgi:citrate lyase beta subunit